MMSAARKPRPTPVGAAPPPEPTGVPPITTLDLLTVLTHRRTIAALSEQMRTTQALLDEAETRVMNRLLAGAAVDSELYTACVNREEGSITPKWKEEMLTHMVEAHQASRAAFEAEVRAKYTAPVYERLIIADKPKGAT